MVENSIRGGISMLRANNPALASSYDEKSPRQDLIYLDANKLYGHAMSQYLPTGSFRILDDVEAMDLDLEDLMTRQMMAIFMRLIYITYYNKHDDYPRAPESIVIDRSMYSPTQSSVFPESAPQKKLTPNLMDKKRYVVHYKNLKLYVKLGFVITKVHRILTFKQSPWLKEYIDFDTHHRSLSDSGFLKDFFTLMNNSVFGKTQENLRKRVQVDVITDAATLRKRVAKPSFDRCMPITDDLAVIQCKMQTLTLNRPIYIGFTVLVLSKLHMYSFHYEHMKAKSSYGDQLKLLFTDTDSLAYAVRTNGIWRYGC